MPLYGDCRCPSKFCHCVAIDRLVVDRYRYPRYSDRDPNQCSLSCFLPSYLCSLEALLSTEHSLYVHSVRMTTTVVSEDSCSVLAASSAAKLPRIMIGPWVMCLHLA